ncbi:hypothetical protein EYF80_056424 [Liparis tanakae]|uniref:Uncharacterized protein n=1 Tax=Liparis tanakae TaxID=230148 RepID=A0A4Z2EXS0_9TELE|nr:hypothetical protein EYF80_056424 [Liparis tanakae]
MCTCGADAIGAPYPLFDSAEVPIIGRSVHDLTLSHVGAQTIGTLHRRRAEASLVSTPSARCHRGGTREEGRMRPERAERDVRLVYSRGEITRQQPEIPQCNGSNNGSKTTLKIIHGDKQKSEATQPAEIRVGVDVLRVRYVPTGPLTVE